VHHQICKSDGDGRPGGDLKAGKGLVKDIIARYRDEPFRFKASIRFDTEIMVPIS
jgi:hypothetical protein